MPRIKSVSITEARPRLTHLVNEVARGGEPYFIVANSQLKGVLIGIDEYNSLQERLEDLEDTVDILRAELEGEPTMPFEEHLEEMKAEKKSGVSA